MTFSMELTGKWLEYREVWQRILAAGFFSEDDGRAIFRPGELDLTGQIKSAAKVRFDDCR